MRFAKFEGILGFSVPSIILADLFGNTCLLVIGAFRSTLFVSVFQGYLLVIAPFRIRIDWFSSKYFLIFLILARIKQCLPPALKKNPLIITLFSNLEQLSLIHI